MAEPCNVCPFCAGSDVAKHEDGTRFICQTCHSWFAAPEKVDMPAVYPPWQTYVSPEWEKYAMPKINSDEFLKRVKTLKEVKDVKVEGVLKRLSIEEAEVIMEESTGLKAVYRFDRTELDDVEVSLVFRFDRFEGPPEPPDGMHQVTITPIEPTDLPTPDVVV